MTAGTKWLGGMLAAMGLMGVGVAHAENWDDNFRRDRLKQTAEPAMTVRITAGEANFTGGLDTHTRIGPAWGAAVSSRWNVVAGEIAYEGSHHAIDNNLAPEGAALWRNGVSGMAKIGP